MNSVPALTYHFSVNLPAVFLEQCTTNLAYLSSSPLQLRQNDTSLPQWLGRDALFPHTETTPSSIKTDAAKAENKTGNGGPLSGGVRKGSGTTSLEGDLCNRTAHFTGGNCVH